MNFDNLQIENVSEQEKILILKNNLKEIFALPKFSTLGHGTTKENAEKILKVGLESANGALDETSISLDDSTDESFSKILHWPHHDYKVIVIIMIPNPDKGQFGGFHYFDSVFEELPEDRKMDLMVGREFRKEYFIPPQFIKGYIDVNSLKLVPNNLYDPELKVKIKEIPLKIPGSSPEAKERVMTQPDIDLNKYPNPEDDDW